uniref:uncharacterized protein isoform X2 n=1 Tax=Myxine glutinosa TaxID=7769 RepID=UPI00358F62BD
MSLSLSNRHSPKIHIPPWQIIYCAALLQGIFAQDQERKCTITAKYTLCFLPEVMGTVDGEATIPCNLTSRETNTMIYYTSWTKDDIHGVSFIQKWHSGSVTHLNRNKTIKHQNHLDIVGDASEGKVNLKIRNLNLGDEGTYYCWFLSNITLWKNETNDGFVGNTGTRLVVGVKPKISFVNQLINGTIELTCRGSGIPLPTLDLLDTNGVKLNTMKKSDSKDIQLQIKLPELAPPVGKYTCVGRNIHGEARVEIILGSNDEARYLTLGLVVGFVFLVLILVTGLAALIHCARRKTLGKGKGCENTTTACKVSKSSPTALAP